MPRAAQLHGSSQAAVSQRQVAGQQLMQAHGSRELEFAPQTYWVTISRCFIKDIDFEKYSDIKEPCASTTDSHLSTSLWHKVRPSEFIGRSVCRRRTCSRSCKEQLLGLYNENEIEGCFYFVFTPAANATQNCLCRQVGCWMLFSPWCLCHLAPSELSLNVTTQQRQITT